MVVTLLFPEGMKRLKAFACKPAVPVELSTTLER
jgi:hypothetical protein